MNTGESGYCRGTLGSGECDDPARAGFIAWIRDCTTHRAVSNDVLTLNEATVHTSLLRSQQKSWIDSEWGIGEKQPEGQVFSISSGDESDLISRRKIGS